MPMSCTPPLLPESSLSAHTIAAKLKSKRYAVLADRSLRASPQQWAADLAI
jgi:hypothetical protein